MVYKSSILLAVLEIFPRWPFFLIFLNQNTEGHQPRSQSKTVIAQARRWSFHHSFNGKGHMQMEIVHDIPHANAHKKLLRIRIRNRSKPIYPSFQRRGNIRSRTKTECPLHRGSFNMDTSESKISSIPSYTHHYDETPAAHMIFTTI